MDRSIPNFHTLDAKTTNDVVRSLLGAAPSPPQEPAPAPAPAPSSPEPEHPSPPREDPANASPLFRGLADVADAELRACMAEERYKARASRIESDSMALDAAERNAGNLGARITAVGIEYQHDLDGWTFHGVIAAGAPTNADGKPEIPRNEREAEEYDRQKRINFRARGPIVWKAGGIATARRSLRGRNRKPNERAADALAGLTADGMHAYAARVPDNHLLDEMRRWPGPCTKIGRAGRRAQEQTWKRESERSDREHEEFAKKLRLAIYDDELIAHPAHDMADHAARMYHRAKRAADDAEREARVAKARELALAEPELYADEIAAAIAAGDTTLGSTAPDSEPAPDDAERYEDAVRRARDTGADVPEPPTAPDSPKSHPGYRAYRAAHPDEDMYQALASFHLIHVFDKDVAEVPILEAIQIDEDLGLTEPVSEDDDVKLPEPPMVAAPPVPAGKPQEAPQAPPEPAAGRDPAPEPEAPQEPTQAAEQDVPLVTDERPWKDPTTPVPLPPAPDDENTPDPLDSDDEWIRMEARRQQLTAYARDHGIETRRDANGRVVPVPKFPAKPRRRGRNTAPKRRSFIGQLTLAL